MIEIRYLADKAMNNIINKKVFNKSPAFDHHNSMGWDYEIMDWHTLYFGLFLIDTFKIDRTQCIDVGGYKGLFSSVYSRHFKEVHTFEPNPYAHVIAKLNFQRQELPNVTLHNIPLFSEEKETDFYIKFFDTDKKYVSGQSNTEKEVIGPDQGEDLHTEIIKVKTKMLDSYNFKPSFIKIDSEGANLDVINGGWNTITTYKPFMQVENDAVLEINPLIENRLKDIGYKKIDMKDYSHVYNGSWDISDDYFIFA